MGTRIFLTGCLLTLSMIMAYSQKPVIDSNVFGKWSRVGKANLSRDGNYMVYHDVSAAEIEKGPVMVVQATHKKWKMSLPGVRSFHMVDNDAQVVFQTSRDSLFIMQMGTNKPKYIVCASNYYIVGKKEKEWLCYVSAADAQGLRRLTLWSIKDGKKWVQDSVTDHWFSVRGNVLVTKKKRYGGGHPSFTWEWFNLENGLMNGFWEGDAIFKYAFDEAGTQLVFMSQATGPGKYGLWYFRENMTRAEPLMVNGSPGIDSSLELNNERIVFSRDGKRVFFSLTSKLQARSAPTGIQVDIWSYRDPILGEAQLQNAGSQVVCLGWLDIATGKAQQLDKDGRRVCDPFDLQARTDHVLLSNGDDDDDWWRGKDRSVAWVHSLEDESQSHGDANNTQKKWTHVGGYQLSPQDRYFLYIDKEDGSFYSYEMESGRTHNITEELKSPEGVIKGEGLLVRGWLPGDKAMLLYDNWDIWRIDPRGVETAQNLTQGYGRRHHIRLRLADEGRSNDIVELPSNGQVLLTAFDTATKYSGYYRLFLGKDEPPVMLTMGPYHYISASKAADANAWLVMRESAIEAPNYYFTENLVHFQPVTEVAPQKKYNWLTAELVTWPLPDRQLCQGMLFKPENLDIHKKYPLLVHYYQAPSDELYLFREPGATCDEINIPYFVSRGYVVFVPDIHYRFGYAGESALASIVSGARFMCRQPWIDSTRMGLQGHSFGGYETNYVVTHTNIFAAAAEGAGVSDMISDCNGFAPGGSSNQDIFEIGQYRMGASLWKKPDIYIQGSPIINADKVTTPLLMMHNKQDNLVPWLQGVEFFSALRRCGKKVWMLQYDRGQHFVQPGEDALDYTNRIEQFFNHYLKGMAAPRWMTEGVPVGKKGLDPGYELDTSGKVP